MPNYQNGKIYKLVNNIDDEIYVGSTTQKLCSRFAEHKNDFKRTPEVKLYQHARTIGDMNNFKIILVQSYPCSNVEELKAKEQEWKDLLNPSLNMINPTQQAKTKEKYECKSCGRSVQNKPSKIHRHLLTHVKQSSPLNPAFSKHS
jgi:predicted GIY-YIG superfamily endonuclease